MRTIRISSEERISELNGLRGVAVLMVLVWHFIGAIVSPDLAMFSSIASSLFVFGRTGVDLFFVLSGFLIVGILVDHRQDKNYFSTFYIRRAARILPPYFTLLAAFWAFTWLLPPNVYFGTEIRPFTYLLFLQNWHMSIQNSWGPGASSVTWSVAIEEQFYFAFPLVVRLIPLHRLKIVLCGIAIGSATLRCLYHFQHPENNFAPYVNTLLRLDGLSIGGLIALGFRHTQMIVLLENHRRFVLTCLAVAASFVPVFLLLYGRSPADTMYYWGHAYLAGLYGLLILTVVSNRGRSWLSALRSPILQFFGLISYSVYLFHPLIIGIFFLARGRTERLQTVGDAALLICAFITTLVFCWLSYRVVEKPILSWARQFKYASPISGFHHIPLYREQIKDGV